MHTRIVALASTIAFLHFASVAPGAFATSSDDTWNFRTGDSSQDWNNTGSPDVTLSAWVTNDNSDSLYRGRDEAYYGGDLGNGYEDPLGAHAGVDAVKRFHGNGIGIDQDKYDYDGSNHYNDYATCSQKTSSNTYYKDRCYDRDSDSHGIDNLDGDELLILEFDEAVALHSFEIGYINGDSDISIFALSPSTTYQSGPSGTVAGLNGTTLSLTGTNSLATKGFELVGHYKDVAKDQLEGVFALAADAFESNVWAIAALVTGLDSNSDHHTDYVKLASVVAKKLTPPTGGGPPTGIPAPATLALFMFGAALLRKNQGKRSAKRHAL